MSAAIRGLCLAESTRPTHTVGNKPTPPAGLGSRLIEEERRRGREQHPFIKRVSSLLPTGIVSVAIRVVFFFFSSLHMLCVTGSVVGKHIHTWPP